MRTNIKKALAVLMTMVMLCGLLPLGALTASAATETVVYSWDFESGLGTWLGSTTTNVTTEAAAPPVANPNGGSYALKQTITNDVYPYMSDRTAFTVEANTDYLLTFDALNTNSGWPVQALVGTDYWFGGLVASSDTVKPSTTAWGSYSLSFNSGNNTKLYVGVKTTWSNTTVYFDNIKIIKKPEASFDGFISNGDFELGTLQNWTMSQTATVTAAAAHSGDYGAHITNPAGNYGGMIHQGTVNVVAGKTYTLSFWMKATVGYVNYQILDGAVNGTKLAGGGQNSSANAWQQFSHTITPTTNVIYLNFCGGGTGTVDEAYVDDVLMVEEKDPSYDGYLYNGDFETGKNTHWSVYQSSTVSTEAKYEGNFGMKLSGSGYNWGGLLEQTINNLKIGQTYHVTLMLKVLADGVNLKVASGSNTLASKYMATSNAGDWTALTLTFVADATTAVFNMCGSGNNTAVTAYIDNVVCSREGGEVYPEALIRFGGASIRDADSATSGTGYGLAFKFDVEAINGQKSFENKYVERSGKIVLDETEYTLIRMGAVMTNQSSVGQSSANFTLDNITGTNQGGKVIDIPAVYLASLSAESISFAVRILDIPENHTGTSIYARPYYVYEEAGQEVVVYGDIKSDTYAKVSNPKSSIKILSIGHSFSKDVMEKYLWNMFKEGGYDEIVIGYLYMGGCSMPKHLYNIQNNLAQYEYGKNSTGTWVKQSNVAALTALQDEEWDYVNIQSSPDYIGGQEISGFTLGVNSDGDKITLDDPMTEYECITPITDWIKANAKNSAVKTDYHMIWAFSEGCNLWSYTYHNYNQLTMYNNIITQTRGKVLTHDAINNIIPCATSIQNGRTSFIGDNFNEPDASTGGSDGYHLNSTYGDYTGALTWYCHYSGDDASVMAGYTGDLSTDEFAAIAEAVNNAIDNPFEITESTHQ